MNTKIIDFHTHPFISPNENICAHKDIIAMDKAYSLSVFDSLGISKFCGSVITKAQDGETLWDNVKKDNDLALELKKFYGDRYVLGFHVHPNYLENSIKEIDRMHALGHNLVGELVPYYHGWNSYQEKNFEDIVDYASQKGMVISLHTMDDEGLDNLVKRHKNAIIVGAHPGEYQGIARHIERAKLSDNYYIDLSGTGVFRYGAIKKLISGFGAHRVIYGSDYPTCSPACILGAITLESSITQSEKECILYKNAKDILKL